MRVAIKSPVLRFSAIGRSRTANFPPKIRSSNSTPSPRCKLVQAEDGIAGRKPVAERSQRLGRQFGWVRDDAHQHTLPIQPNVVCRPFDLHDQLIVQRQDKAVVHADLPFARSLDAVVTDGGAPVAVIVPDHRDDGTPVLSLPTSVPFTFAYGPDSAARHADEARRRSLSVRILRDPALAFDVDIAADLEALDALRRTPAPTPTPTK